MGIRRRIEITAFRRATIVIRAPSANDANSGPSFETKRSEPLGTDSEQVGGVDLAEAQFMTVADLPELTLLLDALVKNDGDVARAAKELGLSRNDFLSHLCGFGRSLK